MASFGNKSGLPMSRAFMKESANQWLHDVAPTVGALLIYLIKKNNGIRVYEEKRSIDPGGRKVVFTVSNGVSYAKDDENKWRVVEEWLSHQ